MGNELGACSVCGGNITSGTLCKGGMKLPIPKTDFKKGEAVKVDGLTPATYETKHALRDGTFIHEVWLQGDKCTSLFRPHHVTA